MFGTHAFAQTASIQSLINASSNGDTVLIPSGMYYEDVVIDKSIVLSAEIPGSVILSGSDPTMQGLLWKEKLYISNKDQEEVKIFSTQYDENIAQLVYAGQPLLKYASLKDLIDLNLYQTTKTKDGIDSTLYRSVKRSWKSVDGFVLEKGMVHVYIKGTFDQSEIEFPRHKIDQIKPNLITVVAPNVKIRSLRLENAARYAIKLDEANTEIYNCHFRACLLGVKDSEDSGYDGYKIINNEFIYGTIWDLSYNNQSSMVFWEVLYDQNLHSFFTSIRGSDKVTISNNYIYDSFDCIEIRGSWGNKSDRPSIISYNVVRNIMDNPIEIDSFRKNTKVRVHNNFFFDSFTYLSFAPFKPLDGYALVDHNIFYNSPEEGHRSPVWLKNCLSGDRHPEQAQNNMTLVHNTTVFFHEQLAYNHIPIAQLYTECGAGDYSKVEWFKNSIIENNIFYLNENNKWKGTEESFYFSENNIVYSKGGNQINGVGNSDVLNALNSPQSLFYLDASSKAIGYANNVDDEYFHKSFFQTDLGAIEYGSEWYMSEPGPNWIENVQVLLQLRRELPPSLGSNWVGL